MSQLKQVEEVMENALEQLRALGYGGFCLQLSFHNHYPAVDGWQELAQEAESAGYEFKQLDTTDELCKDADGYSNGGLNIVIFIPKKSIERG